MEVLSVNRIGNRIERHIETISSSLKSGKGLSFDRFMTNALHAMNYNVYESPRRRPRMAGVLWYQGYPILLCALLSGAFISLPYYPLVALLLGVFGLTAVAMGMGWDRFVGLYSSSAQQPGASYRNIIALHPVQDKPYNVVFAAKYSHYSRLFSPRLSGRLIGGIALCTVLASSILIISALIGVSRLWAIVPFSFAYLFSIVMLFNRPVSNENVRKSNASAPAVLLELASAFATEQPNANLVFITGEAAERPDANIAGVFENPEFAMSFPPERTTVIHLEESGSGHRIVISDRFGFPVMKTGVLFSKLAKEVCARFGIECKTRWRAFGVDAMPAQTMVRGYSSIGLATSPAKGALKDRSRQITSHEYLFAAAQEIVDSIPRIRQS